MGTWLSGDSDLCSKPLRLGQTADIAPSKPSGFRPVLPTRLVPSFAQSSAAHKLES